MFNAISRILAIYHQILDTLAPVFDLTIRVYISYIFFKAGLVKIQSWQTTVSLFEYEYQVPIIPPYLAAVTGTAAELILPILITLGLAGRTSALTLFVFNAVAVYSYRHFLFTDTGYTGLVEHFYWGFLLLVIVFHGVGKFSLDYWLSTRFPEYWLSKRHE